MKYLAIAISLAAGTLWGAAPAPKTAPPAKPLQLAKARRFLLPHQLRAQAYLALINGTKNLRHQGVPERDTGAATLKALKQLQSELLQLTPFIHGERTPVSTGDADVAAAIFTAGNRKIIIVVNKAKKRKTVYVRATGRRILMPLFRTPETSGGLIPLEGESAAVYEIR